MQAHVLFSKPLLYVCYHLSNLLAISSFEMFSGSKHLFRICLFNLFLVCAYWHYKAMWQAHGQSLLSMEMWEVWLGQFLGPHLSTKCEPTMLWKEKIQHQLLTVILPANSRAALRFPYVTNTDMTLVLTWMLRKCWLFRVPLPSEVSWMMTREKAFSMVVPTLLNTLPRQTFLVLLFVLFWHQLNISPPPPT